MTDDLTDIELAAEAATPGPWQSSEHCGAQVCAGKIIEERPGHIAIEAPGFFLLEIDPFVYERPVDYEDGDSEEDDGDDYEEDSEQRAFADARFIALANPARLLALVTELRGLRENAVRTHPHDAWTMGYRAGLNPAARIGDNPFTPQVDSRLIHGQAEASK